jgi:RHS repeat-associated protein
MPCFMDRYSQNTTTLNVQSVQDYYPFGMHMQGRNYVSGNGHRYGFNGKEQDSEVSGNGNQYDYGFRIYNPRIARFLSVDPLTTSYPFYTPYQFAGNNPIWAIDLDGLEELIVIRWFDDDNTYRGSTVFRIPSSHREIGKRGGNDMQLIELNIAHRAIINGHSTEYSSGTRLLNSQIKTASGFEGSYIPEGNVDEYYMNLLTSIRLDQKVRFITFKPTNVLFDRGSSNLSSEAIGELTKVASHLLKDPDQNVVITGFSSVVYDNSSLSLAEQEEKNLRLSSDRVQKVFDFLVDSGVDASRIQIDAKGQTTEFSSSETGRENQRTQISFTYEERQPHE